MAKKMSRAYVVVYLDTAMSKKTLTQEIVDLFNTFASEEVGKIVDVGIEMEPLPVETREPGKPKKVVKKKAKKK